MNICNMGINNSQKNKTITGLRGFQGVKFLRKNS